MEHCFISMMSQLLLNQNLRWNFDIGMHRMSRKMYLGSCPGLPTAPNLARPQRLKWITFLIPGRSLRSDVWIGVTLSSTPHYRKAYNIPKALVRTNTKAMFSTSFVMAEVCLGKARTSLWACFEMMDVLWLHFFGTEALTILILPRINLLEDTKIPLLYPAVPDLIFRFMLQGNM